MRWRRHFEGMHILPIQGISSTPTLSCDFNLLQMPDNSSSPFSSFTVCSIPHGKWQCQFATFHKVEALSRLLGLHLACPLSSPLQSSPRPKPTFLLINDLCSIRFWHYGTSHRFQLDLQRLAITQADKSNTLLQDGFPPKTFAVSFPPFLSGC